MKLYLLFCAWISAAAFAADKGTLLPIGGVTDATPSLEAAYPDEVYILRTEEPNSGVVHYRVQVYAPEGVDVARFKDMHEVAIAVYDEKGTQLLATQLEASGVSHSPPNKEKYRSFSFSVHKSVEKTTTVHIGYYNGLRVVFTRYRLPLKTIDHPKAHR